MMIPIIFGITAKYEAVQALDAVRDVIALLESRAEIVLDDRLASVLANNRGYEDIVRKLEADAIRCMPLEAIKADILIAIGGDGTIIRTIEKNRSKLFGVNIGKLGFLTEIYPADLAAGIEKLLAGEFTVEKRLKLKTTVNGEEMIDCINEAVIKTARIAKMTHLGIYVDGELIDDLRADGLIIATPTGSTSYALSSGGPLVDPRVKSLIIAPIAPFKLSSRPCVVPATSVIGIELREPRKAAVLVLDGQYERTISPNDRIEFTVSRKTADFVRLQNGFYRSIREKLAR